KKPKFSTKLEEDFGAAERGNPRSAGETQDEQKRSSRQRGGEEFGEFSPVQWGETSTNSSISSGGVCQEAFYPPDSILADYRDYAITQSEAPDTYIIGSILPVIGTIMARNVWVPWAAYDGKLYPNIYSILAGPPGNMKSTSIYPALSIATGVLDK